MLAPRGAVDKYQCRRSPRRVIYGSAEGCDVRFAEDVVNDIVYLCARTHEHTYARARVHTATQRPGGLIVSVVACNPRGHRKHVINTCSLSLSLCEREGERESCRCSTALSGRETLTDYCRPFHMPGSRVIARARARVLPCTRVYP